MSTMYQRTPEKERMYEEIKTIDIIPRYPRGSASTCIGTANKPRGSASIYMYRNCE